MSDTKPGYIYDPALEDERKRLNLLQKLNDPATIEHLELVGVAPGWGCLEVGGGGGSIARWLCERVGPEGSVVATDIDTRFLDEIEAGNLEVRKHDILEDDLEAEAFDLVHSRFLLEHLPDYGPAVQSMVKALKPGGWLVVEDVDFAAAIMGNVEERPGLPEASVEIAVELMTKMMGMAKAGGIHPELGRRLPAVLVGAGLTEVGGDGRTKFFWTGSDQAELGRLSIEQIAKVAVEAGFLSETDRQRYLSLFTEPDVGTFTPFWFGAWGRKPVGA